MSSFISKTRLAAGFQGQPFLLEYIYIMWYLYGTVTRLYFPIRCFFLWLKTNYGKENYKKIKTSDSCW